MSVIWYHKRIKMMKFFVVLCMVGVALADVYTADLKDALEAELALIKGVYGDQFDELYLGDFSTEDFSLKNIRMRGLNRVKTMGPSTMYVNTEYLTAFTNAFIGMEDAEFLVEEFKAPYLFYEGNETLKNVKFSVKKAALNIHEGIHIELPKACNVGYGMEVMELDNTTLHVSDSRFNGKDVTPFVHYTVRLAVNDYLSKIVKNIPTIQNCVPFVHSNSKIQSLFSRIFN